MFIEWAFRVSTMRIIYAFFCVPIISLSPTRISKKIIHLLLLETNNLI